MKALFFDLDDTLLNSDSRISDRTRKTILQCKKQGIIIGYITIRSSRIMKSFLDQMPCDCIAHYNGAMIYADGKLIGKNNIPYSEAAEFLEHIYQKEPGIDIGYYCEPYSYKNHRLMNTETNEYRMNGTNNIPEADFQRIRIVLNGYEKDDFRQYATQSMKYQVTVHNTAIITSKNATKENALHLLMNYYHITTDQVISFGDDTGDIGMLKASGVGVAMGNALQEVKDAADYVTLTNDEDGVADYLEKFVLN